MTLPSVMVIGGAGFIGSHTSKALRQAGFAPVVYDNLSTGHRHAVKWGDLVEGDILDTETLACSIRTYRPVAIIHFAASAYVGESVVDPAKYYRNNVAGTLSVLDACRSAATGKIVFSSSCATYGAATGSAIGEETQQLPISPYGRSKLIGEQMLADYAAAYGLEFCALRYFNAAGADPDGEIGEWHTPETHAVPRALMAAMGQIEQFEIFGGDYATEDGTCVRDYVHVSDLARAHVQATRYLLDGGNNLRANLGAGKGTSVRQVLRAVSDVLSRPVPSVVRPRRAGDPAILLADTGLARRVLNYKPRYSDIETIVRTAAPFFAGVSANVQ
jgi:UDP-arabinose 4-epimerase